MAKAGKKNCEVKAIIFDLGGIIVSNSDDGVIKGMSIFFGVPEKKLERVLVSIIKPYMEGRVSNRKFYSVLAGSLRIRRPKPFNAYRKMMIETYLRHGRIYRRMTGLVMRLRKHYHVVALTNTIALHESANIRRKLFSYFDRAFRSNRMGMAKPYFTTGTKNPTKIYLEVCRRIRKKPENCIFIDDMKPNLIPARKIGMKALHYQNYGKLCGDLRESGVTI
ncbi:HAD-IA family hydrolase [Candidatus Woesearchaeota archaeon]|nr:HAD-IA family hydrolase [Candidatus Woesearchaeota archaeon]